MSKTILVSGYGPGISHAVAEKFGRAGFSVALLARNAERLNAAVKLLHAKDIKAVACPADASDPAAVRKAVQNARAALGPITVVHWNTAMPLAGDVLTADPKELATTLGATVVGLVAAVQEALPDLRAQRGEAAVLVTNGGFGLFIDAVEDMAVQYKSAGISIANAAKHKLSRILAKQLGAEKIYVGEVMVMGAVKGTAWDQGNATIELSTIADRFMQLYTERKEHFTQVG